MRFIPSLALVLPTLLPLGGEGFILHKSPPSPPCLNAANFFDAFSIGAGGNGDKPRQNDRPKHRVYQGMTKQEEAKRKANTYQGEKITVREDEDAAMWIEDDRNPDTKRQKKKPFGRRAK